jgi:hypothetical protein
MLCPFCTGTEGAGKIADVGYFQIDLVEALHRVNSVFLLSYHKKNPSSNQERPAENSAGRPWKEER